MRILHITAHMGGGVGSILSAVCAQDEKNTHKILCMEQTQNTHFLEIAISKGVEVVMGGGSTDDLFTWADLIQVEWWHNPLVAEMLVHKLSTISHRVIVWSHISGCTYPYLNLPFMQAADRFLFTSPYSYENPFFDAEAAAWAASHCVVVPSSASGFGQKVEHHKHTSFHVGYVGFLGYNKLSPDFVRYCQAVSHIPNIKFILVGDLSYAQPLLEDIRKLPIADLFEIRGYSKDVNREFADMDVFGYPLYHMHTGTTENTLLEAMAAGVVPVVLRQGSEQYTVKDKETGFLVDSIEEYAQAIEYLYQNPDRRTTMAEACAASIRAHFGISKTVQKLQEVYEQTVQKPKSVHRFDLVFGETPYDWFRACFQGDLSEIQGLAMSETKGSLPQFARCFPADKRLTELLTAILVKCDRSSEKAAIERNFNEL